MTILAHHMVAPSTQKSGIATGQAQLVSSKDALKNGATVSKPSICKETTKNHHWYATFGVSELEDITKWWNMSGANGKSACGITSSSLDTTKLECSKDLC